MPKLVNRAKMTTATTGTGTLTLGSALAGYQTFANAGVANSDIVRYTIEDGSAWEIGLGTYSSTGTTLTRGTIESSTGTAINLSGNATVFVTAAASDLQELVTFAETFALPTADGSTGQVLTTNGAGTLTFSTITGYTDADVDTHLNTGTAASGEVLSWTGSDYDWIAVSGGATDINGLSDGYSDGSSVGLGSGALANDDGSSNLNTAVGINSSATITTGAFNTSVGYISYQSGNGSSNTAVGCQSLNAATSGNSNTAVGSNALFSVTSSGENTAVGSNAGTYLTGTRNIAVGRQALQGSPSISITGRDNIGIGYQTGYDLSTGENNFLGGYQAGTNLTTGSNNVAIGNGALDAATTGGRNIAIGQDAMGLGVATAASGDNVAIGFQAGYDLTTGTSNILLGLGAGDDLTTGTNNVVLGLNALGFLATSTTDSVAIGQEALRSGPSNSVAIGRIAGRTSTQTRGVSIGDGAGSTGVGGGVKVGYLAGRNTPAGDSTVAVGYEALSSTTLSGGSNTAIGYQAALTLTSGTNNLVLGNLAQPSSATISDEITLGNSSITTLRCQVTTITSLSDARDKTDIQPINAGLEFVESLNPVSFTWNMRDGGKVGEADTGFIAQDLQMAQEWAGVTIPGLVYDVNPDKLEAGYGKLIPVLVQAIKDLSAKVNLLEAQLEAQK